ncbi:cytochrome c oxidase subunit II [Paenibacillus dendritiformis]|uniref:cupredoxin domain-containing protein n=1 Tax=Paenibacillus dendritiformis TaxID=130049 RepID=UPI001F54FBE5|nr:cupredoxin domain-containing protein [Paenibacillus dendritiformis]MBG9791795.1 cytochrome c oxidase subunit II [Paenibacillus dendritiformis]
MRRSRPWTIGAAILLSLGLAACGGTQADTPAASREAADAELVITATNYQFDQPEYHIKAGESVRIILEAKGNHGLEVKELGLKLDPNQTEQVITPDKPGTYEFFCTIMCGPGHKDMRAKLIVD